MKPRKQPTRIRRLSVDEISPVDRAANKRRFLIMKNQGDGEDAGQDKAERSQISKEMPEDMSAARRRELSPRADMTDDELREQQAELSAAMNIEVLPDSPLRFPADFPNDIRLYGDPVNRRLPNDTEGRAQAAVGRARQTMDRYGDDRSKRIVWERVVRAVLRHGLQHRFDPEDPLDRSLPRDLREMLQAVNARKCIKSATIAAASFASNVAGHRAGIIEKQAAEERRLLEQQLKKERAKRTELEKELARMKKNNRRPMPPAPSNMSHGERTFAESHESFSWSHDLACEADAIARKEGSS